MPINRTMLLVQAFVFWSILDHAVAFIHDTNGARRVSIDPLRLNYLNDLGKSGEKGAGGNRNYGDGFKPPQFPSAAPSANDGREYNDQQADSSFNPSQSNSGIQDFSYLRDWNIKGNGEDGASYLNQLSGSPQSAPGPAPRYLDAPAPAGRPGVSSYADSLGSWDRDSLFFMENNGEPPLPQENSNREPTFSQESDNREPTFPQSNTVEIDPFSGFPVSAVSRGSSMPPDNDAWYREMSYLKESVSQLSNTLSSLSSQLATIVSSQTGSKSAIPSMSQIEERIREQFSRVVSTQTEISEKLKASIADLRNSLLNQDRSIQALTNQGQDHSQQITNIGQSISILENSMQVSKLSREDFERRLVTLETRLQAQQQELFTASTRTDPRLVAVEAILQEQAELLKQVISNPESRFDVLEGKLEQLQQELRTIGKEPNARDSDFAKLLEQQNRIDAVQTQTDPRIASIEAKMKLQEEQILAVTEAISDTKIAALRAKLTEQQQQLEAATGLRDTSSLSYPEVVPPSSTNPFSSSEMPAPKDSFSGVRSNPYEPSYGFETKAVDESKEARSDDKANWRKPSKWLPWGKSSKKSNTLSNVDKTTFPAISRAPPVPLVAEKASAQPEVASSRYEGSVGGESSRSSLPAFGSYQNAPSQTADKSSGENVNGDLQPERPIGSFKGSAFGSGKGITTERDSAIQEPPGTNGRFPDLDFGRSSGSSSTSNPESQVSASSLPVNTTPFGRKEEGKPPVVQSDQDRWDPDRRNPDAVRRPIYEFSQGTRQNNLSNPGRRKMASDQDQWDPDRPNPDAVKRPIFERSKGGRPSSRLVAEFAPPLSNGSSSDQNLWGSGYFERGDGRDIRINASEAGKQILPPMTQGVAPDQSSWRSDAPNPDAEYILRARAEQLKSADDGNDKGYNPR